MPTLSRQIVRGAPFPSAATVMNALSPSICAPTRRVERGNGAPGGLLPESIQRTDDALARRPGVRLRAFSLPSAGTTKTSPPFEPASLIRPSMKAMRVPSGLQVGSQICSAGMCTERAAPWRSMT